MGKVAKIAMSLPEELLGVVEKERLVTGESRSEYFRRAVETLLGREKENEISEAYARAYRKDPEALGEVEAARRSAQKLLGQEPWQRREEKSGGLTWGRRWRGGRCFCSRETTPTQFEIWGWSPR